MVAPQFLRQVVLRDGNTVRHPWVDKDVTVGQQVRLKDEDPERWWTVTWVGSERRLPEQIQRGWKVGGIDRVR